MSESSNTPDEEIKTPGERTREKAEQRRESKRKLIVREAVDVAHEAVAIGNYYRVGCLLRDYLIPALDLDRWALDTYHTLIEETPLPWHWEALDEFLDQHRREAPNRFIKRLSDGEEASNKVSYRALGSETPRERAETVVERAFYSVESVAKFEGIIPTDLSREVDVFGHTTHLGTLFTKWEYESPERKFLVEPTYSDLHREVNDSNEEGGHAPFTIIQGLPGFGKSTAIETLGEDRYLTNFDPFREDHKLIEFDIGELEPLYDVRSGRPELRSIREEAGEPLWYDEIDMEPLLRDRGETITEEVREYLDNNPVKEPEVEIYVPLCRGLEGAEVPYDTEAEEWVVRPFTIPAADLSRRALNTLLSHTTDVQSNFLERAYQRVDQQDDWSLADLSDEIWRTDAQEGVKNRLENALKSLQHVGFIRDRSDRWALDWGDIFRDTETITVFCTADHIMPETSQKMMVMSYLLNAVFGERRNRGNLPRLFFALREAHWYAPTDKAAKEDETEEDLQDAMAAELQQIASRHRHEDMEIASDSQQFSGQLKKRIRDHVERVISFRAHKGTVEAAFRDLIGGKNEEYVQSIARNFTEGEAAAIGYTGSDRPFEMPIKMLPPMCHHYDPKREDSGFTVRVAQNDNEEFREAPWNASIPDRLKFDAGTRMPTSNVGKFVFECCSEEGMGEWERVEKVYAAYQEYARENLNDVKTKRGFGRKLSDFTGGRWDTDVENKQKMVNGEEFRIYQGLKLNRTGLEWAEVHQEREDGEGESEDGDEQDEDSDEEQDADRDESDGAAKPDETGNEADEADEEPDSEDATPGVESDKPDSSDSDEDASDEEAVERDERDRESGEETAETTTEEGDESASREERESGAESDASINEVSTPSESDRDSSLSPRSGESTEREDGRDASLPDRPDECPSCGETEPDRFAAVPSDDPAEFDAWRCRVCQYSITPDE